MATHSQAEPPLSSDDESVYDLIDPPNILSLGMEGATNEGVIEMMHAFFKEREKEEVQTTKFNGEDNKDVREKAHLKIKKSQAEINNFVPAELDELRWCIVIDAFLFTIFFFFGDLFHILVKYAVLYTVLSTLPFALIHGFKDSVANCYRNITSEFVDEQDNAHNDDIEQQMATLKNLLKEKNKEIETLKFNIENSKAIRESALVKMKNFQEELKDYEPGELPELRWCFAINVALFTICFFFGSQLHVAVNIAMFCVMLCTILWTVYNCGSEEEKSGYYLIHIATFIELASTLINDTDLPPSSAEPDEKEQGFKPRTLQLKRKKGVFGFNLYGAYVYDVASRGPADLKGMLEGDQIIAVNDVNVETASHKAIVRMIKRATDEIRLVVRYNPERLKDIENAECEKYNKMESL